jgi:UDP-glucose 4-epimerase
MRIVVTGGLGYIGSSTVLCMLEKGYEPIIIDNLSNSNIQVLDFLEQASQKKVTFYEADLTDYHEMENIFRNLSFDGVIHFAAFKAVGESMKNPLDYYDNNIVSLINIVKLALKNNVFDFIFSSSCTVYGQPKHLPIFENSPFLDTPSAYGKTKQICENILQDVCATSGLKAFSLRYFNPIGAHKSGKVGEFQKGEPQNLVPLITQTATGKRKTFFVYGDDYSTRDGSAIRDYIDVNDLAAAHLIAMEKLKKINTSAHYDALNLGTGRGTSVLELISVFEQELGIKLNYKIKERRVGDVQEIYADTSKARAVLNWETVTSLKDSLKSAYEWEIKLAELK